MRERRITNNLYCTLSNETRNGPKSIVDGSKRLVDGIGVRNVALVCLCFHSKILRDVCDYLVGILGGLVYDGDSGSCLSQALANGQSDLTIPASDDDALPFKVDIEI